MLSAAAVKRRADSFGLTTLALRALSVARRTGRLFQILARGRALHSNRAHTSDPATHVIAYSGAFKAFAVTRVQ
ncbi:MAG: hypothetical protein DI570_24960 [Phenylobacterium zucineum]|nr:MAG: hypothetical protein DI570_24960 [Phenylobacterium zucineum]